MASAGYRETTDRDPINEVADAWREARRRLRDSKPGLHEALVFDVLATEIGLDRRLHDGIGQSHIAREAGLLLRKKTGDPVPDLRHTQRALNALVTNNVVWRIEAPPTRPGTQRQVSVIGVGPRPDEASDRRPPRRRSSPGNTSGPVRPTPPEARDLCLPRSRPTPPEAFTTVPTGTTRAADPPPRPRSGADGFSAAESAASDIDGFLAAWGPYERDTVDVQQLAEQFSPDPDAMLGSLLNDGRVWRSRDGYDLWGRECDRALANARGDDNGDDWESN